jgi:hypothetical protein
MKNMNGNIFRTNFHIIIFLFLHFNKPTHPCDFLIYLIRILWGYGWNKGERSFHGPSEEDQEITIAAADGSAFILHHLSIKSTNTDLVSFTAHFADGTSELLKVVYNAHF